MDPEEISQAIDVLKARQNYLKIHHKNAYGEIIAVQDAIISLQAWILQLEGRIHGC